MKELTQELEVRKWGGVGGELGGLPAPASVYLPLSAGLQLLSLMQGRGSAVVHPWSHVPSQ